MKKIAVIPTLLTLGNAVCGFASIVFASKIGRPDTDMAMDTLFALSGWLIVLAMVFDVLDGYVARLSKTASNFGLQLDSLCDAISFGVAPAFLLMRLGPGWELVRLHQALALIAVLYMVCAILRLARFNVETMPEPMANKRFRGLPSPGAAGCIASLAILRGIPSSRFPTLDNEAAIVCLEIWAALGGLAVALLMVSRFPYPHLTKQILRGRKPFRHLVQLIFAGFLIFLIRDLAPALLFWFYALGMPVRYAIARRMAPKTVLGPVGGVGEHPAR